MTSLDIRADDMGLRSQPEGTGGSAVQAPIEPTAPAAALHNQGRNPHPVKGEPQRRERRKGQRRKRNEPVLLDTRSQRDRRQSADNGAETNTPGVDVYV